MSDLTGSWARSLRAANRSPATIEAYTTDVTTFETFYGHDATTARRADIEGFLADCRDRGLADATVARRFRSLQQFYRWCEDEHEIEQSPMARMHVPKIAETMPDIIGEADFAKLLEAARGERVDGKRRRTRANRADRGRSFDFEARRDEALLRMLWTTGVRASEIMGLGVADVDLDGETVTVMGKGSRPRVVGLLPKAADALDRYLRERRKHEAAREPWLWLGRRGRLGTDGLRQMLERRCHDAGLDPINPHRFRHTFSHNAKVAGMSDDALMVVGGWRTAQMLQRYGRSAAAERALEAHRRLIIE